MSPLRVVTAALSLAALGSAVLLASVLVVGPLALTAAQPEVGGAPLTLGLAVDGVRAVLLLLVTGVAAVVAAYSGRNLAGQQRLARYAALVAAVVAGLALAIVSASLPLLAAGWVVAGLAMAALVGHTGTGPALAASRSVRARLLVGDAALVAAALVAGTVLGAWDVADLAPAAADAPVAAALVAVLVVAAGAVRSALVPAHRWLPEVAEAPSPVSALLHAGFVNGIGLLSLLLWPLVGQSALARGLALALGVVTVVVATLQIRVRPDVKGRLVSSTSSQMGYLAVTLGLGLPAAALVHVLGHGMWKAGLFLGAGGAVERARAARAAHGPEPRVAGAAAAALAVGLVLVVAAVPFPGAPSLLSLPAYVLPVLVAALAAAVAARSAAGRPAALAVVLAGSAAYVGGIRLVDHALETAFGWSSPGWGAAGAVLLASLVAVLVAVGAGLVLVDVRALRGGMPRLARAMARTTLIGPRSGATVRVPVAHAAPSSTAASVVVEAVEVAQGAVAPTWPLASFVASSPLAGLEHLDFGAALGVARATWGARTGVDAALLRASLADGTADPAALARVAATVSPGPDLLLAGGVRERAALVAAALVADEPTEADIAWARSTLGSRSFAAARRREVSSPAEAAADGRPELVSLHERGRRLVSSYAALQYGAPAWPVAAQGVWAAVRADAAHLDRLLGTEGAGAVVRDLPEDPAEVVAAVAARCGLAGEDLVPAFSRVLARDPGWVAHLAWRRRVGLATGVDEVVDLLAARLTAELLVVVAAGRTAPLVHEVEDDLAPTVALLARASGAPLASVVPAAAAELLDVAQSLHERGIELLRLQVLEESYRRPLVARLAERAAAPAPRAGEVQAQVVACIDVRSERLRRHLEPIGPWETLGAAGFFGLPLAHVSPAGARSERLPALLRPERTVADVAQGRPTTVAGDAADAVHAIESAAVAPFALAEAAGWVAGPSSLLHTCAPGVWDGVRPAAQADVPADLVLERCDAAPQGFELSELIDAAAAFLRTTGLLHPAPVVLLMGHGGHAANNPHVAAYDCGACGGFAGDVSARAMAQVLNDPRVRAGLSAEGIEIPAGTWFGAALHDTTRDMVSLLVEVPEAHRPVVDRLQLDLAAACDAVALERASLLPEQLPHEVRRLRRDLSARAVDWAQVRPEWGLARSSAIVIGPRSLTSGLDLDGRVFLHSYRHDLDTDGSALEFLLSAPLVVAQWISTQYWCATVDPERFGAGDKTTHNVLVSADGAPAPLSGVVTGARGDLRIGLPWQAVSANAPVDGRWPVRPFHEPLRLLAVVHADASAVDRVLARRPEVARLVLGEWISLVVLEPGSGRALRHAAADGWVPVDASDVPVAEVMAG
jgi:uncharacterized protein YbcC (UPF0753/DUF2309 family)/NADH:ubiquinone oxidoreductase subunit 5 (subunit L)/multisubunit Na+/H+ antiporter MnhA subunit